ncbi:MAG: RNA methyltransferase [Clostridia bacterium]|nr:RNA methyltransferase [Clostridia bacterium]
MLRKETEKFVDSSIFEGMTSISALIKAIEADKNNRRIIKILFDKDRLNSKRPEYGFLTAKSHTLGYELELCDAERISEITIGNSHGGIVAICSDREISPLASQNIKPDGIYYMLEGVEDPYNFGYAVRSLYAAGADGIIVGARNWMGAAGVVARSSAGASELIDMYSVSDCGEALDIFRERGYTVICAGIRDSSDLFDTDLRPPLFVIIGGEKRGISRAVLDKSDAIVRIGYGNDFNGSLSTAATAAVFGFEINRKVRNL